MMISNRYKVMVLTELDKIIQEFEEELKMNHFEFDRTPTDTEIETFVELVETASLATLEGFKVVIHDKIEELLGKEPVEESEPWKLERHRESGARYLTKFNQLKDRIIAVSSDNDMRKNASDLLNQCALFTRGEPAFVINEIPDGLTHEQRAEHILAFNRQMFFAKMKYPVLPSLVRGGPRNFKYWVPVANRDISGRLTGSNFSNVYVLPVDSAEDLYTELQLYVDDVLNKGMPEEVWHE